MLDKYKLIGRSYDYLSKLYSANAIEKCKLSMLRADTIPPESKVLFAGAGHGKDAIHAAELGAEVIVVDISPTMINTIKKNLEKHPKADTLNITIVQSDILKIESFSEYDMVIANFFLNVFDEEKMSTLLNHLSKLCKPEGEFVIGDFNPATGSIINKAIQNIYWYAAATAFFAIAGNAIHQIYDYQPRLEKLGYRLVESQTFNVAGRALYYSLRARKEA